MFNLIPRSLPTPMWSKETTTTTDGPYKCVICEGRGIVPHGFYNVPALQAASTSNGCDPIKCRTCDGSGVMWS